MVILKILILVGIVYIIYQINENRKKDNETLEKEKMKGREYLSEYLSWYSGIMNEGRFPRFFKLADNSTDNYIKKDTIFCFLKKNKVWQMATPTESAHLAYISGDTRIKELWENRDIEEVDIIDEKWIHPHINKEIRKYISL